MQNRIASAIGGRLGSPGIVLWAPPGSARAALARAQRVESGGWALIACPTAMADDNMGLAEAAVLSTTTVAVSTSIANIYRRHPVDYAASARFLHELSDGRFIFGVGVGQSLPEFNGRFGITEEKPVRDVGSWLDAYQRELGEQEGPPIYVAALRSRMIDLGIERFDGVVCANASRRELYRLASEIPKRRRTPFVLGVHTFVCVTDDRERALAALRYRLAFFMTLPNYRAYWREVGYEEEVAKSIELLDRDASPEELSTAVSEQLVDDCCVLGSAEECAASLREMVREGVSLPIVMPVAVNPRASAYSPDSVDHDEVMALLNPAASLHA
jgi:alkanesulfonate monooxygenase SsuD/methylene tetrahydromethanopterin reductase-like flavin-dependent oxidoreductase (luciferase family)